MFSIQPLRPPYQKCLTPYFLDVNLILLQSTRHSNLISDPLNLIVTWELNRSDLTYFQY